MKSKYYILTIISAIIVGGIYFYIQHSTNIENRVTYPAISNFELRSIHEIKQNNFTLGNFNVEGYVVKIYTCPPCTRRALCKPCMQDNIVISENDQLLETYSLSDNEMILFVNNPKQFQLGGKYRFSVRLLDYKTTGESINDIELVGYDLIG